MPNNFPNFPLVDPGLDVRIIDGSSSQTLDQLYFVGTTNNYVTKVAPREVSNYSSFGNFWTKQVSVQDQFRDICGTCYRWRISNKRIFVKPDVIKKQQPRWLLEFR
jgi:hypothetical protein